MRFQIFLFSFLINFFAYSVIFAQETGQKGEIKWGPKIGWYPFLLFGKGGSGVGEAYTMGVFAERTTRRLPGAWASGGIEIGLFYYTADMSLSRRDIDPVYRSKPLAGCPHTEGSIPLNLKSLTMPIVCKLYLGKYNKFCFSLALSLSYMLTAKKEDPEEAFRATSAYALLDEKDKSLRTQAYKKAYSIFDSTWQKRKNKYTALSLKNIFPSLWCLGFGMGMQYEMDLGLLLGCGYVLESMGMEASTLGLTFTLGYNLNKVLKWS